MKPKKSVGIIQMREIHTDITHAPVWESLTKYIHMNEPKTWISPKWGDGHLSFWKGKTGTRHEFSCLYPLQTPLSPIHNHLFPTQAMDNRENDLRFPGKTSKHDIIKKVWQWISDSEKIVVYCDHNEISHKSHIVRELRNLKLL